MAKKNDATSCFGSYTHHPSRTEAKKKNKSMHKMSDLAEAFFLPLVIGTWAIMAIPLFLIFGILLDVDLAKIILYWIMFCIGLFLWMKLRIQMLNRRLRRKRKKNELEKLYTGHYATK